MPKYLIRREIDGAGGMSAEEQQQAAQKSCDVLRSLGPEIQWVTSFVSDDAIHCIYIAPNDELIRKHAAESGFPADELYQIQSMMDPTSAERAEATATA